ncbi:uncharacterized protein BO66DRAFT_242344 [Aspergillus aculeatinus CBS 121060]|uniref:Uncharacterized protein n=1 Tax=Aspergillus aculeatinus CBS 121060 TaxID=1448322 RepID=A0ACD1GSM7_9EURO|nr:hypothetical protein BO66DRAFT_242344 [Aspergillus aculeatinus CBS 121060]RAH64375.1 hypothetical protein BO66DRAFT_242344 [Aspergillus aculeatinus CBS 121060]
MINCVARLYGFCTACPDNLQSVHQTGRLPPPSPTNPEQPLKTFTIVDIGDSQGVDLQRFATTFGDVPSELIVQDLRSPGDSIRGLDKWCMISLHCSQSKVRAESALLLFGVEFCFCFPAFLSSRIIHERNSRSESPLPQIDPARLERRSSWEVPVEHGAGDGSTLAAVDQ